MKTKAKILSVNAALRYRVWTDLSIHEGQTAREVSIRLKEPLKQVRDAIRALIKMRMIRGHEIVPGTIKTTKTNEVYYETVPGSKVNADGTRGLDAELEKLRVELDAALEDEEDDEPTPRVIRVKRPPPLPEKRHPLEECWPWPSMRVKETA